ncbi:hypothetical protein ACFQ88_22540 [Paenibacillus sp. NPDC056579]|uniref:hypothetical protein n=1 Tax=Paenibacillus sp. NPDC056579 TaxID=3345871 RepID=UPI0036CF849C
MKKNLVDLVTYVWEKTKQDPLTNLEFRPFLFNDGTIVVWKDEKGTMRIRIVAGAPERIDFTLQPDDPSEYEIRSMKEFEYVIGEKESNLLVHFKSEV